MGSIKFLVERLDKEVRGGRLLAADGSSPPVGSAEKTPKGEAAAAAASKPKMMKVELRPAKVRVVPKKGSQRTAQAKKLLVVADVDVDMPDYESGPVNTNSNSNINTTNQRPKKTPKSRLPLPLITPKSTTIQTTLPPYPTPPAPAPTSPCRSCTSRARSP